MRTFAISADDARIVLQALQRAEKATTPDGEFVYCPLCMKMVWLGHAEDCELLKARQIMEHTLAGPSLPGSLQEGIIPR